MTSPEKEEINRIGLLLNIYSVLVVLPAFVGIVGMMNLVLGYSKVWVVAVSMVVAVVVAFTVALRITTRVSAVEDYEAIKHQFDFYRSVILVSTIVAVLSVSVIRSGLSVMGDFGTVEVGIMFLSTVICSASGGYVLGITETSSIRDGVIGSVLLAVISVILVSLI